MKYSDLHPTLFLILSQEQCIRWARKKLNIKGNTNTYDENYLRYVTLLSKIKNETASGLLPSLASGVIPLPYQLHVLNRAMEWNTIRYVLADEVGLGKTIEANMVIKELKARGLIQRILVVCPTGLVTQWWLRCRRNSMRSSM